MSRRYRRGPRRLEGSCVASIRASEMPLPAFESALAPKLTVRIAPVGSKGAAKVSFRSNEEGHGAGP